MNLLALRYFLEIAKHLSFSEASKQLHISQPGLSQQISALENQLGFKLLNRTTRSVSLTAEGQYLYKELTPSFEGIEETINYMTENKINPKAKIKIATVPSAASIYLPKLLNQFLHELPGIEFFLYETTSSQAIDLIRQQKFNVALIRTPINKKEIIENGIQMLEFQKHPLQLIVSNDHHLAYKESINLQEVKNEFFIHYDREQAPSLSFLVEKACFSAGFTPKKLCTGSELLTIANMVSNNLGVALVPRDMVKLIESSNIKAFDLHNQELESSISVVWIKGQSTLSEYIIKILKDIKYPQHI